MRFVIACLGSKGSSCSVAARDVVAGQFLSEHTYIALKQVEGETFRPQSLRQLQDLRGRNILSSTCFTATCSLKSCLAIPLP